MGAMCRLSHHFVKTENVRGVVVGEDIWWRKAHRVGKHRYLVDLVRGYLLVSKSNSLAWQRKNEQTGRQAGTWGDRRVG